MGDVTVKSTKDKKHIIVVGGGPVSTGTFCLIVFLNLIVISFAVL